MSRWDDRNLVPLEHPRVSCGWIVAAIATLISSSSGLVSLGHAQGARQLNLVPDLAFLIEDSGSSVLSFCRSRLARDEDPFVDEEDDDQLMLSHLDTFVIQAVQLNVLVSDLYQNMDEVQAHLVRVVHTAERVRKYFYARNDIDPVRQRWDNTLGWLRRMQDIVAAEGHLVYHPFSDPVRKPAPWYWIPMPGNRSFGARGYGSP